MMKKSNFDKFSEVLIIISAIVMCICLGLAPGIESETTIVKATVTSKEYVEAYTDFGYYYSVWKGKYCFKFKDFPEEYNVTVQYNDIVEIFDNKNLYEAVEIGDTIDVELRTCFREGEIKSQYISMIN